MARHLAQLNLGRAAHDLDAPEMADFMAGVDRVNAIAEASPGFVWKYETEPGGAVPEEVLGDPRILVNMTVWEDAKSFSHFVWNTLHRRFYMRRGEWFAGLDRAGFVMWWVEPGARPTLAEALARLDRLRAEGPTEDAFGWESLADVEDWRMKRCA